MINAIIYTSNTGSTEKYARLLALETGLPVCSAADAPSLIPKRSRIIYLGWLMAGGIKGFKNACKRYDVAAVCAVGMGQTGTQEKEVRTKNAIPAHIPLFTLQGNFDVSRLRGAYRLMMSVMVKTAGKALKAKTDRTLEEDDMLDMMLNGGERVDAKNLRAVLDWYGGQR